MNELRTKCWCGRPLYPTTNGMGGTIDTCTLHGVDTAPRAEKDPNHIPRSFMSVSNQSGGVVESERKPCTVKGCPGFTTATRKCECCEKRAAWQRENLPKPKCEICGGEIDRGEYCAACKPLAKKVGTKNKPVAPKSAAAPKDAPSTNDKAKATRTCIEDGCKAVIEFVPGVGRPPLRCEAHRSK